MKYSKQREVIRQIMAGTALHPTADMVYEWVRRETPNISLATVYRNLEILSEAGVIKKLEISSRQKRFDWDPADHGHVYCIQCHRIDNIATAANTVPVIEPIQERGYQITGHRIEFFGLCPKCHQQQHASKKGDRAMACNTSKTNTLSDTQRQVLEALANSSEACGSKELAAATGLEAKQISCQITALKNKGYVDSPVRCKYEITEQGKGALA